MSARGDCWRRPENSAAALVAHRSADLGALLRWTFRGVPAQHSAVFTQQRLAQLVAGSSRRVTELKCRGPEDRSGTSRRKRRRAGSCLCPFNLPGYLQRAGGGSRLVRRAPGSTLRSWA